MTRLRDRHVIITGGSQGIGAAVAWEAVARGARVSLVARREDALRSTAESIDGAVLWQAGDVADDRSLRDAIHTLELRSGPCDVLVCSAGVSLPGRFLDVAFADFDQQWQVNVRGSIAAARCVLPGMVQRGTGHLVLIGSTAGIIGVPGYTGYAATKFAIRGFAESLRYEVEPLGVRVSVLHPPDTDTPGFAAENLRKPPETAAISGRIKPVPAEQVATALVRGIESNTRNVTVDAATRTFLRFGGVIEPALRWSFRRTVMRTRGGS